MLFLVGVENSLSPVVNVFILELLCLCLIFSLISVELGEDFSDEAFVDFSDFALCETFGGS